MTKNSNPGELLKLSGIYWQTCTLHAAVKLDIFTSIGEDTLTAKALADKMAAPQRSLSMLMDALCAMGLLKKKAIHSDRSETDNTDNSGQFTYTNTPTASDFLSQSSPRYIGFMIMHHHDLLPAWARLDESIMTGNPIKENTSFEDETRREHFLMGMFNIAMATAPQLVPTIDLSGKKHLLDLGGGPGTYAIQFCRHNPKLNATVFDFPTSRPFAEKTIARFHQEDRVSFQGGDFLKDEIQGTFDVVWLSHILHAASPDECEVIIEKARSVLLPGGMIIIHDFILNNTKDAPLFPTLFSLNMLLVTGGGQAYSEQEITGMLSQSGFTAIQRSPFVGPNDSGLITGILPR